MREVSEVKMLEFAVAEGVVSGPLSSLELVVSP